MGDYHDDPFLVLGVDRDSSEKEIKTAYRKLAMKNHPDRQTNEKDRAVAHHKFAKIAQAYEILTDPVMRHDYEQSVSGLKNEGGGGSGRKGKKSRGGSSARPPPKPFRPVFNDPYEVWKKDFRETFGIEYPGAKYDWVDPSSKEGKRIKSKNQHKAIECDPRHLVGGPLRIANCDENNGKTKGWNPFRRNNKNETQIVVADQKHTKKKFGRSGNTQLVQYKPQSTALVQRTTEINNRPTSMKSKSKKKGKVTTTKTIITRPDGSTETVIMRTGLPAKKKTPKMITAGPTKKKTPKMITADPAQQSYPMIMGAKPKNLKFKEQKAILSDFRPKCGQLVVAGGKK